MRRIALSLFLLAACGPRGSDLDPTTSTPTAGSPTTATGTPTGNTTATGTTDDCSQPEVCDGVDNDCDGDIDEPDATDASAWYADVDGDGYGDPATEQLACTAPANTIDNGNDCDDSDPAVNPDSEWYADGDGDGYGTGTAVTACDPGTGTWALEDGDCDDTDDAFHPGAPEVLGNGQDEDCNGFADNVTSHATDIQPIWDANCINCHVTGPFAAESLELQGDGYPGLVNTPSIQLPTMDRVEPGDPANSYVWHKLHDTQLGVGGSAGSMPPNAAPLAQADLDLIEAWILEGCPP